MKNFFLNLGEKIKQWIKGFTFKDWLIVILSVFAVIFFFKYRHYQNKAAQIFEMYDDSLYTYKNKLGEEYAQKMTYIQSVKDLKKTNSELAAELKNLKKGDQAVFITQVETKFIHDTIKAESNNIVKDSVYYTLNWSDYSESDYYGLAGRTVVRHDFSDFSTYIDNFYVKSKITLDLIDTDGVLSVIAKTNNPYVNVSDINSIVIDPTQSKAFKQQFKKKHWHVGPFIGAGFDKDMKVTPTFGIGVNYSVLSF